MGSNECMPSTTWAYRKVKISRRLQGSPEQRPKGTFGSKRRPVDPKDPHTIRITYRGGAEAWWALEYQGELYVAPGHLAIHDAFMWFLDGNRGVATGGSSRARAPKRRRGRAAASG